MCSSVFSDNDKRCWDLRRQTTGGCLLWSWSRCVQLHGQMNPHVRTAAGNSRGLVAQVRTPGHAMDSKGLS
jgi:hypothetical protein